MGNNHSANASLWGSDDSKEGVNTDLSGSKKPDDSPSVLNLQMAPDTPTDETLPTHPTPNAVPTQGTRKPLGTFDELHKPCKDISFQMYEGVKFCANRGLSSHFQVQHSVHLNNDKSSYRFGATFVGTKQPSPSEAYPVLVGEMNTEGDLQAQLIHLFGKSIKLKCIAQTNGPKIKSLQAGMDINFRNSCLSLLAADPDIFNKSGMFICQYLQGLTPTLSVGADLIYQRSPMRQNSIMSLAGRYKTEDMQFAANAGSAGVHMSFYRKANDFVQVGVEMETSLKTLESITTFGYQMDIPKMNLLFKGMVTSEWTIGSSFEKRLLPFPIAINMTATYNLQQDKATVGLGCTLG